MDEDAKSCGFALFLMAGVIAVVGWIVKLGMIIVIGVLLIAAFVFFFSHWPKATVICVLVLIAVGAGSYVWYQNSLTVKQNSTEVRIYLNTEEYTYTYYDDRIYNKYFERTIPGNCIITLYENYNKTYKCWDTHIEVSTESHGSRLYSTSSSVSIETFLNNMSLSEYYVSMTYAEYEENYDANLSEWLVNERELVEELEAETETSGVD